MPDGELSAREGPAVDAVTMMSRAVPGSADPVTAVSVISTATVRTLPGPNWHQITPERTR